MTDQTKTRDRIVLDVTKDGWTSGIQLGISQLDEDNSGHGYRIAGPKYNGSQKALIRHTVTKRDADEIRAYLRAVYPDTEDAETIERLLKVSRDPNATTQDFRNALHGN